MSGLLSEARLAEIDRAARAELLCLTIRAMDRRDAAQVMTAALEDMTTDGPEAAVWFFDDIRENAAWWADSATPTEVEAYVAAGLRAIERTAFCMKARKRLFAVLWETFPEADRRAFIARVDPKGQFRGRAA